MAPEVIKQDLYNQKIDIWGIGLIAHILLCGCPPFDGDTNESIQYAIIYDKPKFGGVKSSLTNNAVKFIEDCLSKDPEKRPSA